MAPSEIIMKDSAEKYAYRGKIENIQKNKTTSIVL